MYQGYVAETRLVYCV